MRLASVSETIRIACWCSLVGILGVVLPSGMLRGQVDHHGAEADPADRHAKVLNQPAPEFPREQMDPRVGGQVQVELMVSPDGTVTEAEALAFSLPEFINPALAAVRQWTFDPAYQNGEPVAERKQVMIRFGPVAEDADGIGMAYPPDTPADQIADVSPRPIDLPFLDFPTSMRRLGASGNVQLELLITTEGKVGEVHVVDSNHPGFDDTAIETALGWKFKPARTGTNAVPVRIRMGITFKVNNRVAQSIWYISRPDRFPADLPEALHYDEPPVLTDYTPPVYPTTALLDRRKGNVAVKFVVGRDGAVHAVVPASKGDPDLMAAAIAAVETFKFRPARKAGRNSEAILNLDFKFGFNWTSDVPLSKQLRKIAQQMRKSPDSFPGLKDLDAIPAAFSRRPPVIPPQLARAGVTGEATIEFIIDRNGRACLPRVRQATHPEFGYAAMQAVAGWRFAVPRMEGKPVDAFAVVPISFGR